MDSPRRLEVTVFDRNMKRVGWVNDFESLWVTDRWLAPGSGELTVRATHPRLPDLMADGAMVQVTFWVTRPDLSSYSYALMLGRLRDPRGGLFASDTVTFTIEDEWRILRNSLAWVRPDLPLAASTLSDPGQSWDVGAPPAVGEDSGRWGYAPWTDPDWPYGPVTTADEVLFFLLETNVNRRWVARFGDIGRVRWAGDGSAPVLSQLPQVRFGTIESYVVPLLEASNRGVKFQMGKFDEGYRTACHTFTPTTWPQVFTPDSGVVVGGEWSIASMSATDVVAGGPGDLTARAFYGARETEGASEAHRDIIEVFREATGAPVQWDPSVAEVLRIAKYYLLRPEVTADQKAAFTQFLVSAAAKEIAEGAQSSGVSVTLQESGAFQYFPALAPEFGGGFSTGDIITVGTSESTALGGLRFTERITQVTVAASKDKGVTVTPQLGKRTDDPDAQLALAIRNMALAMGRRATEQ